MYDIPELEKKWRKYKRKQIQKPLIISSVTLLLLVGVTALALTYLNKPKEQSKKQPKEVAKPTQAVVPTKNSDAIVITKISNSTQPTKPINSSDSIDLSNAEIVKPNVPDDEIRVIGFDKKDAKKIKKKYEDILIPQSTVEATKEKEIAAALEEQFRDTQDPQDSLKVARYYYKIGNYKKAETWAVNTNNLDGDIEESWLIFAKARAKQGFRTDAIKVLQSYYDETNSPKAKTLLDKLRRGTFK